MFVDPVVHNQILFAVFTDLDTLMGATAEVGCTEFGELPFGACEDPVT